MPDTKLDLTQGDLLTQRGIVGGLLAGAFIAAQLAVSTSPAIRQSWEKTAPELTALCAIFGVAATHLTFELFMPLSQFLLGWIFKMAFLHEAALRAPAPFSLFRRFRERYLASAGAEDHYALRIKKDENLRRTSTYLTAAGIVGAAASWLLLMRLGGSYFPFYAAVGVIAAGCAAQVLRTISFGRNTAAAFRAAGGTSLKDVETMFLRRL